MTKAYQPVPNCLWAEDQCKYSPPHFFVALNTAMSMNLLGKSNMFTYSEKDRVIIAAKLEQKAAVADLFD